MPSVKEHQSWKTGARRLAGAAHHQGWCQAGPGMSGGMRPSLTQLLPVA